MRLAVFSRKTHRYAAIIFLVPMLAIFGSGLLLQFKKESHWIQPRSQRGSKPNPEISFAAILAAAQSRPEAGIQSWADVDRLDVRPGRGIVKIRGKNRMEIQVDTATGEVLQVANRRSDLIEQIHDGSFFHEHAKLWIFLPTGLALIGLWFSGVHLWILPHWNRRRSRRARAISRDAGPDRMNRQG